MKPGFHSLQTARRGQETDANTRMFTGDGTPFLRLPDLKTVEVVRLGSTVLPFTERRRYPLDADGNHHQEVTHELLTIEVDEDGTPVLLRSKLSNDGIWQKGATIAVTGEWGAEAETGAAPVDPKAKPQK